MEFSIRALSLVPSVPADIRESVSELLAAKIEFRAGMPYSITLPHSHEQFAALSEPEKTLIALRAWGRLYRYPKGDAEAIHILAPADTEDGDLGFYRLDLIQPPKPRRGLRPSIEFTSDSVMTSDDCATWLVDMTDQWARNPDQKERQFALVRPCPIKLGRIRLAWVGPQLVGNTEIFRRLAAVGKVYDADITPIVPRSFRDVTGRLSGIMPLDAVVICRHFARSITDDAVPLGIPRHLIHYCDSREPAGLEQQAKTWIELTRQETEKVATETKADEGTLLLATILRGMVSHSKIGPFSHCQKQTVLTGVRARHMNVPAAERILDRNCEEYQDTKDLNALFLWKEHNDGRQYFLNPRRMREIKLMILAVS